MSDLMNEIRQEQVGQKSIAIWWLGQAGFIYKFHNGATVAIDPYLSTTNQRLVEPPMSPEDLDVDLILASHDHLDHFDYPVFRQYLRGSANCRTIGPASVFTHYQVMGFSLGKFSILNRGEEGDFNGLHIRALYAEHSSGRFLDAVGYIIDFEGVRLYQTGDSLFNEHLLVDARETAPDLLVVPINGRLGNMNAEEAAELTAMLKPQAVIPMHYGMFSYNTVDPQIYLDAAQSKGISAEINLCEHGGKWIFSKID